MRFFVPALALAALAACSPAPQERPSAPPADKAAAAPTAGITLQNPRVRATLGQNTATAGYLVIANGGASDDRLVAAACDCAEAVSIHTMRHENGRMIMAPIESLTVPAGSSAALDPGGDHLMLTGLKRPLKAGETVSLTLTFANAAPVEAAFPVVADPRTPAPHASH